MQTTIYVARHGQTPWNAERKLQGQCDIDLSPLGIEQAKRLGERLKPITFDTVYTSDLKRTIDTAKYAMGGRTFESTAVKGLGEMGFGIWEGENINELIEREPEMMDKFYNRPAEFSLEGAETIDGFIHRVVESFESIVQKHLGQTILIVAHGGVVNALKCKYLHQDVNKFWRSDPYVEPTALSILTYDGDQISFKQLPDASHIEGLE